MKHIFEIQIAVSDLSSKQKKALQSILPPLQKMAGEGEKITPVVIAATHCLETKEDLDTKAINLFERSLKNILERKNNQKIFAVKYVGTEK